MSKTDKRMIGALFEAGNTLAIVDKELNRITLNCQYGLCIDDEQDLIDIAESNQQRIDLVYDYLHCALAVLHRSLRAK